MELDFMPVGIDPGNAGGIAAIDGDRVVYARKCPPRQIKVRQLEADAKKKKWAKSRAKAAGKRFAKSRELLPKNRTVFDAGDMRDCVSRLLQVACDLGYLGIFVAIERLDTHVRSGQTQTSTMVSGGRCQNAWNFSLDESGVRWGEITSASWKPALKLSSDKDASVPVANDLFSLPDHAKKNHDLCEAVLLAYFLREHCPRYLRV